LDFYVYFLNGLSYLGKLAGSFSDSIIVSMMPRRELDMAEACGCAEMLTGSFTAGMLLI
jgi:hypothetical protein